MSDFEDDFEEMQSAPSSAPSGQSSGSGGHAIEDFFAFAPANRCIYRPTKDFWPNESVDRRVPAQPLLDSNGNPVLDGKGKVKMLPASVRLARERSVERVVWAPGEPEIVEDKLLVDDGWIEKPGARTYNTYLPPTIKL